jgi:hypothetical protein
MRGSTLSNGGGRRAWIVGLLATAVILIGVAPVLAIRVPTDPEPDIACDPEYGTGWVTHYATTTETPADSSDWWVSVEFTIAGDDASCELSLAVYELASGTFAFPQTLFDSDSGTFGAGTHTLTAALPLEGAMTGCWSQYDFVFGPVIDELTFENRYDDRQVRARIVGSDECPSTRVATPTPTPTPTPTSTPREREEGGTPTPTPREDEQGGNPTPTPGDLPDTSFSPSGSSDAGTILSLVMLGSLALLIGRQMVTVRRRR